MRSHFNFKNPVSLRWCCLSRMVSINGGTYNSALSLINHTIRSLLSTLKMVVLSFIIRLLFFISFSNNFSILRLPINQLSHLTVRLIFISLFSSFIFSYAIFIIFKNSRFKIYLFYILSYAISVRTLRILLNEFLDFQ